MAHTTLRSRRARLPLVVLVLAFATGAALFLLQHLKRELAAPPPSRPLAAWPAQEIPGRAMP